MEPTSASNQHQLEQFVQHIEKVEIIDLLGPFQILTKLTGLDCSQVAKCRNGKGNRFLSFLTHSFAIVLILVIISRAIYLIASKSHVLSFAWAEANFFGFMGLHAVVCAFCLYGWTKNEFVAKYLQTLNSVKSLRTCPNLEIDDYSKLQRKSLIFAAIWFIPLISYSIYSSFSQKILFGGIEEDLMKCGIMIVLTCIVWLTVSTVIAYYNIVSYSMARELTNFNEELRRASEDHQLKNPETIAKFSHRQVELLKMVKETNRSLASLARIAPLFSFFVVINGIYLTGFIETLPKPMTALIVGNLICSFGFLVVTFLPASVIQKQLKMTSKVLMLDQDIEKSTNPETYQTYRLMVDRSINYETRIRVVNGFPIDAVNFNIAMLIVPNFGAVLIIVKKVLESNGITV